MSTAMRAASAALGLLTVAWPLAWAPGWAYAAAAVGAIAVLGAAFSGAAFGRAASGRVAFGRAASGRATLPGWHRGPVIAVAAAIASCAFSRAGAAVLAAEGLFILGYLLAAGAPAGLSQPGSPVRWLRAQARPAIAGLIAGGAVLAALALHPAASAALTVAALAAAVAAYLIALPSPRGRRPGRDHPG